MKKKLRERILAMLLTLTVVVCTSIQVNAEESIDESATATNVCKGDVTFDGCIDLVDASAIMKSVTGFESLSEEACMAADLNENGFINLSDAVWTMQIALGMISYTTEFGGDFSECAYTPSTEVIDNGDGTITVELSVDGNINMFDIRLQYDNTKLCYNTYEWNEAFANMYINESYGALRCDEVNNQKNIAIAGITPCKENVEICYTGVVASITFAVCEKGITEISMYKNSVDTEQIENTELILTNAVGSEAENEALSLEVMENENSTITVLLNTENANLQDFDYGIIYDPSVVSYESTQWDADIKNFYETGLSGTLTDNVMQEYNYISLTGQTDTLYTASGPLASITFAFVGEPASTSFSVCKNADIYKELVDKKGEPASLETVAVIEDIVDYMYVEFTEGEIVGDIDGDGSVTLNDANLILKASTGAFELSDMQFVTADINENGKVNLSDVTLVLKMALGIISNGKVICDDLPLSSYIPSISAVDSGDGTVTVTIVADGDLTRFDMGLMYDASKLEYAESSWNEKFKKVYTNGLRTCINDENYQYVALSGAVIDETSYNGDLVTITFNVIGDVEELEFNLCINAFEKRASITEEITALKDIVKEPEASCIAEKRTKQPEQVTNDSILSALEAIQKLLEEIKALAEQCIKIITDTAPTLSKEVFNEMLTYGKDISVTVTDETNSILYRWDFEKQTLSDVETDIDLSVSVSDDEGVIPELSDVKTELGEANLLGVSCNHQGKLPGTAVLHTFVGDKFENGETIYLYRYTTSEEETTAGAVVVKALAADEEIAIVDKAGAVVLDGYVDLKISDGDVYFLSTELLADVAEAPVEEAEWMYGDMDRNREINLEDAQLALKAALGIGTFTALQKAAMDVDSNSDINLTDANYILKMALGIMKLEDIPQ